MFSLGGVLRSGDGVCLLCVWGICHDGALGHQRGNSVSIITAVPRSDWCSHVGRHCTRSSRGCMESGFLLFLIPPFSFLFSKSPEEARHVPVPQASVLLLCVSHLLSLFLLPCSPQLSTCLHISPWSVGKPPLWLSDSTTFSLCLLIFPAYAQKKKKLECALQEFLFIF